MLTLGRNANRANVLASDELLAAARRHPPRDQSRRRRHLSRARPACRLSHLRSAHVSSNPNGRRIGPVDFVRRMEEALIRVCARYGVRAGRIAGLTGVWCRCARKQPSSAENGRSRPSASTSARGITSHGFAFNVTTDLRDFHLIVPCGIPDRAVTSLERNSPPDDQLLPSLEALAHQAARQFGLVFDQPDPGRRESRSPRAQAAAAAIRDFPAQDTPLQIPAEVAAPHAADATRPSRPELRAAAIYNPAGAGRCARSRNTESTIHANRCRHAPDGRVHLRRHHHQWLKKAGDTVEKDEPLFEISTDKVDAEIPSPVAGVLSEIKIQEGATVRSTPWSRRYRSRRSRQPQRTCTKLRTGQPQPGPLSAELATASAGPRISVPRRHRGRHAADGRVHLRGHHHQMAQEGRRHGRRKTSRSSKSPPTRSTRRFPRPSPAC